MEVLRTVGRGLGRQVGFLEVAILAFKLINVSLLLVKQLF